MKHYNGLIYRIQLGVFSKPNPMMLLEVSVRFALNRSENSSVLKYYAGVFYSLNGVTAALNQVKKNGFPDAFIVAFLDGKPISTEKAKEIEFAGMKF